MLIRVNRALDTFNEIVELCEYTLGFEGDEWEAVKRSVNFVKLERYVLENGHDFEYVVGRDSEICLEESNLV